MSKPARSGIRRVLDRKIERRRAINFRYEMEKFISQSPIIEMKADGHTRDVASAVAREMQTRRGGL